MKRAANKKRNGLTAVILTGVIFVVAATFAGSTGKSNATGLEAEIKENTGRDEGSDSLKELGRWLFYEERLSLTGRHSCGSCHIQERAFSDGLAKPLGATGHMLRRNTQPLFNLDLYSSHTWASSKILTLEAQLEIPLFASEPAELGLTDKNTGPILNQFADDPAYRSRFRAAFPFQSNPETIPNIKTALVAFLSSIKSFDSPVDRYLNGDSTALTPIEIQGLELFSSGRFGCENCHNGPNLSGSHPDIRLEESATEYFSNGLYNIGGTGDYPAKDQGLFDETGDPRHRGLFRVPTLRNIALTAPYMHDGSLSTLEGVIDLYARGGRLIPDGPHAGDGSKNPNISLFLRPFKITASERRALLSFLNALTDQSLIKNPDYAKPVALDRN